jgi:hypothetical protein
LKLSLRADCASCAALCCVAPGFSASADFAIDKAPGQPCPHLDARFRCSIHARLRPRGFPGCAAYDCFGAGQHITQGTFGASDWRQQPAIGPDMFASFAIMRQLHELLWYVTEALALELPGPLRGEPAGPLRGEPAGPLRGEPAGPLRGEPAGPLRGEPAGPLRGERAGPLRGELAGPLRGELAGSLRGELAGVSRELHRLTEGSPGDLAALDVGALRQRVIPSLRRASELARGDISPERNLSGSDLIGQHLRGRDLRGASLRGAHLTGTDLTGADLRGADLTGADLRGADLRGADLTGALFLTQSQVDAARGDGATRLSLPLRHPLHWPSHWPRPRSSPGQDT